MDGYGQKLLNSGYDLHQVRTILINGIKGYEGRRIRCEREGRKIRRTAKESRGIRSRRKLLDKVNWYKKRPKEDCYDKDNPRKRKTGSDKDRSSSGGTQAKTVLFIEQTCQGELGKRLKDLMARISPMIGFGVKMVERTGGTLGSKFPQASLWDDQECGRPECITCHQGGESRIPCTRRSLVYENVCASCHPEATGKGEIKDGDPTIPSIYVGETSRTIQERLKEHWSAYQGGEKAKEGSHIHKHQQLHHDGQEPHFILRAVEFHRSALARQTGEAVRIQRRGGEGAVLNSKSEFNRSYIPRLKLVTEEEIVELEKEDMVVEDMVRKELQVVDTQWHSKKIKERAANTRKWTGGNSMKETRRKMPQDQRPSKRRKYALLSGWGEEAKTTVLEKPHVNHEEVGEGLVPDNPGEGPERQMTPDKEYLGIGVFPPPPQSQDDLHPDNTPSIGGSTSTGLTSEVVPDHLVTGEQTALLQSNESVHDITLATSADVIYEHPRGGNDDRSDMADGTTMIGMNNDAEGDDDDKVLSLTLTPSSDNNLKHSAVKQSKKTFIPVVGEGVDMKLGGDNKCGGDDDKDGRSGQQNEVVDNIAEYEGGDHDKVRCVIDKKRCMTHRCDTIPTKVSSQVWKWIVKKKEYGFVKTKTTKHICMVRIKGREVPDMTTSLEDHRLGKVAVEVGRFSVGSTQSNPETRDLRIELKSERTNLG